MNPSDQAGRSVSVVLKNERTESIETAHQRTILRITDSSKMQIYRKLPRNNIQAMFRPNPVGALK